MSEYLIRLFLNVLLSLNLMDMLKKYACFTFWKVEKIHKGGIWKMIISLKHKKRNQNSDSQNNNDCFEVVWVLSC